MFSYGPNLVITFGQICRITSGSNYPTRTLLFLLGLHGAATKLSHKIYMHFVYTDRLYSYLGRGFCPLSYDFFPSRLHAELQGEGYRQYTGYGKGFWDGSLLAGCHGLRTQRWHNDCKICTHFWESSQNSL